MEDKPMENANAIIIFLGCIMAIMLFGKVLILPIKIIVKLILNSLLGGLLIALINWIGGMFGVHIGLNIFTAIFVRNAGNTRSNITYNI